jgi:hypothetical protein
MGGDMTLTLPDTTTVEELDWKHVPPCDAVEGYGLPFPWHVIRFPWGQKKCDRPAAWWSVCGFCGHGDYMCDPHYQQKDSVLYCGSCKRVLHPGKVTWTRL